MKRLGLSLIAVVVLSVSGCALHRDYGVPGCLLPGYIKCFMGDAECLKEWDERTAPVRLTALAMADPVFMSMEGRVWRDFHVSLRDTVGEYRFVGWVTWNDGSYGVLFHDKRPLLSMTGMMSGGHGRGMMLTYNNRSLIHAVRRRPEPELSVVIRGREDSPSDLVLDFDCQEPYESFAVYEVTRPLPRE